MYVPLNEMRRILRYGDHVISPCSAATRILIITAKEVFI